MITLHQMVARALMACGVVAGACPPAIAQNQHSLDAKQISDSIDCSQWTQNPDGTWNGGPNARVGGMAFPNTIHMTMTGYAENGVDEAAALLKKCGKR